MNKRYIYETCTGISKLSKKVQRSDIYLFERNLQSTDSLLDRSAYCSSFFFNA